MTMAMKATLFDYGTGNLHSLARALARVGVDASLETDAAACATRDDLLVFPGVGAFGFAAARLEPGHAALRAQLKAGRPCLGVCLGMQLLFDESEEGTGAGLGVFSGRVTTVKGARVPHIGWTKVEGYSEMYFAHRYACRPTDVGVVTAWATHEGDRFPAIIKRDHTIAIQFHPEKSSTGGLALLAELVGEATD